MVSRQHPCWRRSCLRVDEGLGDDGRAAVSRICNGGLTDAHARHRDRHASAVFKRSARSHAGGKSAAVAAHLAAVGTIELSAAGNGRHHPEKKRMGQQFIT